MMGGSVSMMGGNVSMLGGSVSLLVDRISLFDRGRLFDVEDVSGGWRSVFIGR